MRTCAITGNQHQNVVVFRTLRFHPSTRARTAKWRFQKSLLWRAFFKRCVFDDRFLPDTCGRHSKPERKYLCFQTKTDTCERGLYIRYYTQFCRSTHRRVPQISFTQETLITVMRYSSLLVVGPCFSCSSF